VDCVASNPAGAHALEGLETSAWNGILQDESDDVGRVSMKCGGLSRDIASVGATQQ
jgi:hypothetical protein